MMTAKVSASSISSSSVIGTASVADLLPAGIVTSVGAWAA